MSQTFLIPPGKTQTINCPAGTSPQVKAGAELPQAGPEATFVVLSVSESSLVLGPLKAGEFTLEGLCQKGDQLSFQIEAPDPQKVQQTISPVSPLEMIYPTWIWFLPILVLAILGALYFLIKKLLNRRKARFIKASPRRKLSASEKMDDYIAKVEREKLLEESKLESLQFIYSEGISKLRALLEAGLNFKNPGATSSEFMGEFKSRLPQNNNFLSSAQVSQIESLFMQVKQVIYAQETPDELNKKAFFKNLKEISQVLKSKLVIENPSVDKKGRKK